MDLIDKLYTWYKERKKVKDKENEQIKKKFKSMSLVELNAYQEIINRKDQPSTCFSIIMSPFYITFYLGVFGLILKYAFQIDVLSEFKLVSLLLLDLLPLLFKIWFICFFVYNLFNWLDLIKLKRKLLLNK